MSTSPRAAPREDNHPAHMESYEQLAKDTRISVQLLKAHTDPRFWNDHIDIDDNPSVIQLQSFVGCAISELRTTTQRGKPLLDSYREDFEPWTMDQFTSIGRAFKRELINVLHDKDITPIEDRERTTQADKLYAMAQGKANTPSRTQPIRSPPRTPVAQSATQSLAPSPLGTPVGPSRARVEIRPSVMPSEPPRAPTQSREPTVPPPMVPQHSMYSIKSTTQPLFSTNSHHATTSTVRSYL
jgi:hypothetical protein